MVYLIWKLHPKIYSIFERPKIKKWKFYFYLANKDDKLTHFILLESQSFPFVPHLMENNHASDDLGQSNK
jgi:hypothetical protein